MHKIVGSVFKLLGMSIILMFLLDMSLIFVDTISVNTRVNAMSSVIQNEVARYNCVPNALQNTFKKQLDSVKDQSNIATQVKSNLKSSLTVAGKVYTPLNESNVKGYGEIQHLAIQVKMNPSVVLMPNLEANRGKFLKRARYEYTMNFVYTIPCLRYLK